MSSRELKLVTEDECRRRERMAANSAYLAAWKMAAFECRDVRQHPTMLALEWIDQYYPLTTVTRLRVMSGAVLDGPRLWFAHTGGQMQCVTTSTDDANEARRMFMAGRGNQIVLWTPERHRLAADLMERPTEEVNP